MHLLLGVFALLAHAHASSKPLTNCNCTSAPTQQWILPSGATQGIPIASVADATQCWTLTKTAGGVTCDGLCVVLGPCAAPDTPTWQFDATTQRLTVVSPPSAAGSCLDENTAARYLQAYPNCINGDTHQLWAEDGSRRLREQWTGSASCVAPPDATCGPPPPPAAPYGVTNSPDCLTAPNWHDVAGALFFKGAWHVFQGCNAYGGTPAGWHHAVSTNLVDWVNLGIEPGLSAQDEPYGASSPCSGFVTVDDAGVACAGFRQCGGNWPGRSNSQVPLELRCSTNDALTNWTSPEYLFWFYFNRGLPYDPVRPWIDADGRWYATISADGCNGTHLPCDAGGREYIYSSPALRGASADWQLLPEPLFTSAITPLSPFIPAAAIVNEFVTAGYFGALAGDSRGGATRCLTNNAWPYAGDTHYYCGTQAAPGAPLIVNYSDPTATGLMDWGSTMRAGGGGKRGLAALRLGNAGGPFKMARTLSPSSPNQVTGPGRKVVTAWIDAPRPAQALPRDLSLDPASGELLQAFSPELQALRSGDALAGAQIELLVTFAVRAFGAAPPPPDFGVAVLIGGGTSLNVTISLTDAVVGLADRFGPLLGAPLDGAAIAAFPVHVIVDRVIATAIFNNRTAITYYAGARPGAAIQLFGVDGALVTATWHAWTLRNANITCTGGCA